MNRDNIMNIYKVYYEWDYGEIVDSYWLDENKAKNRAEYMTNNNNICRDEDEEPIKYKYDSIIINK